MARFQKPTIMPALSKRGKQLQQLATEVDQIHDALADADYIFRLLESGESLEKVSARIATWRQDVKSFIAVAEPERS